MKCNLKNRKGLQDDENKYVGIKIIPNEIAMKNGIKEVLITNDVYMTILNCSKIKV